MQPELDTIKFRTVVEDGSQVLPNCQLRVTGSVSGNLPPNNSGDGVFTVNMRKTESLSIIAYKSEYAPNTTKVRNAPYNELATSNQKRRDIPLVKVPPCGAGKNVPKAANEVHHVATYGMGQMSGTTTIWVDFYNEADMLTVYDGNKPQGTPLVRQTVIANQKRIPIHFTQGAVTVVIDTSSNTSSWEYVVNCP